MANLLTPLKLKNIELKNRIVLPPLATEKCTEAGAVTPEVVAHYRRYAEAGVGLIITEHAYITDQGKASPRQMSLASDEMIAGLRTLTDAIREAGSISCAQINHAGMAGKPEIVGTVVGPSPLAHPTRENAVVAKELTQDEIQELIQAYVAAARRAKEAGFDMVQIHAAHGYLLNQFNSPLSNQRSDQYGGSVEQRFGLALEVVAGVRGEVGPDYPVLIRLGADDRIEGGLTLADSKQMAPRLVEAGVDCVDLSGGFGGYRSDAGQGYFTYLAEGIKEVVDVPVVCTGGIIEPEFADKIIRENQADLVGIGRQMLKEYNWAKQAIDLLS